MCSVSRRASHVAWLWVLGILVLVGAPPATPNMLMDEEVWQKLTIGLSEICYWPAAKQAPTWVEVINFGDAAVSIAGWCLSDTKGPVYSVPRDLPPVPPSGLVLIQFQGASSPAHDDKEFTSDGVAKLYGRKEGALNSLRGPSNECALYISAQCRPQEIVEYVAWGEAKATANARAAGPAGVRTGGSFVFPYRELMGDIEVVPGMSIGRKVFRRQVTHRATGETRIRPAGKWMRYSPHEVTPGAPNRLPAPGVWGPNGRLSCTDATYFSWWWYVDHRAVDTQRWQAHLEVASAPDFENMIVDELVDAPYAHRPPLESGKFYWRVRMENGTSATPWSPTTEFEILP